MSFNHIADSRQEKLLFSGVECFNELISQLRKVILWHYLQNYSEIYLFLLFIYDKSYYHIDPSPVFIFKMEILFNSIFPCMAGYWFLHFSDFNTFILKYFILFSKI